MAIAVPKAETRSDAHFEALGKYTDADIGGASPERQRYVTREVSIDLSRY